MNFSKDDRAVDFYKDTPQGKVMRTMTLNDITYWASDAFIIVVLVLFVVNHIDGGSATHLGLALLMYKAVEAVASIIMGKFFDSRPGYLDELWGLASASFLAGLTYMLLSFGSELWHLYIAMAVLGYAATVNKLTWRIIFYNSIKKSEYAQSVGIYQTAMAIATGLALALGGIVGDQFGFNNVLFFGGVVITFGGILPLGIKCFVPWK